MPFAATWMEPEIIILSEVSHTEEDKYHMISLICGIFKKMVQIKLIYKTETNSQTQKTNLWLPKGKGGGGINKEVGINISTLLNIKQIITRTYCTAQGSIFNTL